MREVGCFSVIADEGRDCSNKEQMPLIIRYVDKYLEIQESFMGFMECVGGTTGVLLAELIERNCLDIGLDMSLCRGARIRWCGKYDWPLYSKNTPRPFIFTVHLINLICVWHILVN